MAEQAFVYCPFEWPMPVALEYGEPVQEAEFNPGLHLRDTVGRFTDMSDAISHAIIPAPGAANRGHHTGPLAGDWHTPWRESYDPSDLGPPSGVTYSPEVAKIQSSYDAETYLAKRGVDADFRLPDTDHGRAIAADTDFFRQISQAVTDAQDRYPALTKGPVPFKKIRFLSNATHRPQFNQDDLDGIWATTAPDVDDGVGNPNWTTTRIDGKPARSVGVILHDANSGFQARHEQSALGGNLSPADLTPYGRLMHEMGHAVYEATGTTEADFAAWEDDNSTDPLVLRMLDDARYDTIVAGALSMYSASNAAEAWAEIFTTLNTPGALEKTAYGVQTAIKRVRQSAAKFSKEKLL